MLLASSFFFPPDETFKANEAVVVFHCDLHFEGGRHRAGSTHIHLPALSYSCVDPSELRHERVKDEGGGGEQSTQPGFLSFFFFFSFHSVTSEASEPFVPQSPALAAVPV